MNNMTHRMGRRLRAAALGGVVVLAAAGLVGCSASRGEAAGSAGEGARETVSLAAHQRAVTPSADPTARPTDGANPQKDHRAHAQKSDLPPGVTSQKPKDPRAPKHIAQVERHGKAPHPTIEVKGKAKPFTQPISYTDGLKLRITKMTQGKMKGHGPGVFPGRPMTNFHVSLTNNSNHTFTIGVVVVTVQYGEPSRLAHPVYGPKSQDFFGTIKPGKSAKAVYGFSVPKSDRDNVTMTVDIDGHHQLATFTGAVK